MNRMSTEARNGTKKIQAHGSLALKLDIESPLDENYNLFGPITN